MAIEIVRTSELPYVPASHEDSTNPGVLKKVLFTKENLTGEKFQMINFAKIYPGNSFRPHYHEDMDEILYIINGRARLKVGDEEVELGKGDAALMPMGLVQEMTNIGNIEVDFIVVGVSLGLGGKTIKTLRI